MQEDNFCHFSEIVHLKTNEKDIKRGRNKRNNKVKFFTLQKVLDGMPVCLRVSPDGIEVLTSDEKVHEIVYNYLYIFSSYNFFL